MNGNHCFPTFLNKQAVKYLLQNCSFKTGSQIFCQVIGIAIGSDPAPIFANLFLLHYKSAWIGKMKNIDHLHERKFGHVYRFIEDLIAVNDGKEFDNSFKEIYPEELELKKENANDIVAIFLDLNIIIKERDFSMELLDERDRFNFYMMRLPYNYSNIPSIILTISAEILKISRATSSYNDFLSSVHRLTNCMKKQRAVINNIIKALSKMIFCLTEDF